MKFKNIVDEIFIDHHGCLGLNQQEIDELIEESTVKQRSNWLKKIGYELEEEHD